MEEENYLDKPASEITADILGSDVTPYVLGGGLTTAVGSAKGGAVKFDPRILGNMQTQVMKNAPGAKFRLLADPKYIQYAKNILPQAISKNPMSVASASVIPLTAATAAYDVVQDEAGRVQGEMQRMSDIEGSQMQKAGSDLAERLRRVNLIEEARSAARGTQPFGGEEGITMGNIDEYFAANPDFSGIGDVVLPGEEPRVAPMVQQTTAAPTMGGIDYSSAFAGGQTTAPTAPSGSVGMAGFRPQFEGQTLGQFLRYEDTPEQATMQRLDPQGRLRQFTADGQLAPNLTAFEAESAAREARIGAPKVGLGTAIPDMATGELSMSDYRSLAKQELGRGAPSKAIAARAKQLMSTQEAKSAAQELQSDLTQAQIEKAKRPAAQRAPTSPEIQLGIVDSMTKLQAKIDAGEELTDEEQMAYDSGNAFLQLQSRSDFFESPFQQKGSVEVNTLPSATDPKGKELIEKMKKKYPDSSEEEILTSLRSANRLA